MYPCMWLNPPHLRAAVRPEEKYDPRSLFEQLEEQKNLKQEQWEEEHMLSMCAYAANAVIDSSCLSIPENLIYTALDDDSIRCI